ncbi:hypothetical protein KAR91_74845 [Candidatus Pacearchaeota archaeon]|nr:hypothetical protein [Candidatus Pacearchaeota archaeon]
MKVHILMQMDENIIERVSTDLQKMNDCAEALNEGKGEDGSYGAESFELEDFEGR